MTPPWRALRAEAIYQYVQVRRHYNPSQSLINRRPDTHHSHLVMAIGSNSSNLCTDYRTEAAGSKNQRTIAKDDTSRPMTAGSSSFAFRISAVIPSQVAAS